MQYAQNIQSDNKAPFIEVCQRVYIMLSCFSMTLQTEILSTETSGFLKQMIILNLIPRW